MEHSYILWDKYSSRKPNCLAKSSGWELSNRVSYKKCNMTKTIQAGFLDICGSVMPQFLGGFLKFLFDYDWEKKLSLPGSKWPNSSSWQHNDNRD